MPILLSGLHYLVSQKLYTTPFELALRVFQRAVQSQIWLVARDGTASAAAVVQELQQANYLRTSSVSRSDNQASSRVEQETEPQVADVLIVTATDIETKTVIAEFQKELGQPFVRRFIGPKTYFYLGNLGGAHTFLVRSEMGGGGPGGSMLTVAESILALRPAAIIMVGIAFGVDPQKQRIGDILVARQLLAYELQLVWADPSGNVVIYPRGERPPASPRLLDRFRGGGVDWKGARVHFGLVLSGDKLVNHQDFRDQLRKLEPEAIGGEMEGAGLYAVAQQQGVDWILVKAICDYADGHKDLNRARRQQTAARNAIRFVIHVLRQGGFATRTDMVADDSSDGVFD
jgi:nucleoside phosphorylase